MPLIRRYLLSWLCRVPCQAVPNQVIRAQGHASTFHWHPELFPITIICALRLVLHKDRFRCWMFHLPGSLSRR